MSTKIKSICLRREEVQALQRDGRATVARKVKFSDEYSKGCGPGMALLAGHHATPIRNEIGLVWRPYAGSPEVPMPPDKVAEYSPFGKVGTRRAVCEDWAEGVKTRIYKADFNTSDGFGSHVVDMTTGDMVPLIWESAKTMPIDASRYTVEVESVAVEKRNNVWHWVAVVRKVEAAS